VLPVQIPSDSRLISMWPPSISLAHKRPTSEKALPSRPCRAGPMRQPCRHLKSRLPLLAAAGIDPLARVLGVVGLHLQSSSVMASSTLSPVTS
jgi:hypothetical protein